MFKGLDAHRTLKLPNFDRFSLGFLGQKFQFGNCKICATGALQIMETFGAELMPLQIVKGQGAEGVTTR